MKRKLSDKLISKNKIQEDLKLIKESDGYYISKDGNIYADYGDNKFYPIKNFINNNNGYLYCNIKNTSGKMVQKRVHRLVAEAYLDNPDNLPVVMHKDNDKTNPSLENLKYGTVAENTKAAFDDKLEINDAGFADSQSIAVCMLDLEGSLINTFGSIREASRITNMTPTAILYQCNHKMKTKPRCEYYFRYLEEYDNIGFVL